MQVLAGVSFLLLVGCAWWVAIKLLRLAHRTRQLPEASLGLMILSFMGIGYPLAVAALAEPYLGLPLAKVLQSLSSALIDFGFLLMLIFTWRVFRAPKQWARGLCLAGALALAVHWGAASWEIFHLVSMKDAVDATRYWAIIALAVGILGSIWTSFESLRYRFMLQRRVSMGLANPVVSNRFLLWGAMGVATALGAIANVYFLIAHIDVLVDPVAQLVTSTAGIVQAALLYLTFSPPEAYSRWLEGAQG